MNLTNKEDLLKYLKLNGLWAKKGLSQNFLVDRPALDKIVKAAELKPDDFVIEIGSGLGVLTQELTKNAGEVVAVEMDEKLAELLCQQFKIYNLKFKINDKLENLKSQNNTDCHSRENGNLEPGSPIESGMTNGAVGMTVGGGLKIINADILKVNLSEIIGDRKYKVVANIPYHITSKILELFLSRENKPELMVLLVQKEVAERVCAKPGAMSTLSVSVQLYGKPEIIDIVPKESFFPRPKVSSAILRISNIATGHPRPDRGSKLVDSRFRGNDMDGGNDIVEKSFFRLVHVGFSSRRKTLANNLSAGYHITKEKASDIIKSIGLKETVRAQELGIEEWKRLADAINHKFKITNNK